MFELKVGDVVKVPHGFGTVKGFERFDDKGMEATPSTIQKVDKSERVLLNLHEGHTWLFEDLGYAAFPHDILELVK